MTQQEIKELIGRQSMRLPNAGIDHWPGELIRLDYDELQIDGEIQKMKLYAWFDKKDKNACGFILQLNLKFIYMDYFYEASAVWNYYTEKSRKETGDE